MLRRVCQMGQELNLKFFVEWRDRVRSLLYLDMTDCESVKIFRQEFLGIVEITDRIAKSSVLYKEGQFVIWAEKLCIIWSL